MCVRISPQKTLKTLSPAEALAARQIAWSFKASEEFDTLFEILEHLLTYADRREGKRAGGRSFQSGCVMSKASKERRSGTQV